MVDVFQKHISNVATDIGKIAITLVSYDPDDSENPEDGIYYTVDLKDANGLSISFGGSKGNLRNFLTVGQITTIETFLSDMRAKAAEMLT